MKYEYECMAKYRGYVKREDIACSHVNRLKTKSKDSLALAAYVIQVIAGIRSLRSVSTALVEIVTTDERFGNIFPLSHCLRGACAKLTFFSDSWRNQSIL